MEERGGEVSQSSGFEWRSESTPRWFQTHLLQEARPVGADGLDAQEEFRGHLFDGLAGRYQAQHLELTVGQRLVGQLAGIGPYSKASFSARDGLTYLPPLTTLRMALTSSSAALSFVR
jgi:hypothetical protein